MSLIKNMTRFSDISINGIAYLMQMEDYEQEFMDFLSKASMPEIEQKLDELLDIARQKREFLETSEKAIMDQNSACASLAHDMMNINELDDTEKAVLQCKMLAEVDTLESLKNARRIALSEMEMASVRVYNFGRLAFKMQPIFGMHVFKSTVFMVPLNLSLLLCCNLTMVR